MKRASSSPRIYLSYRRADTAWVAQAIYQRLSESYPGQVFFDVNTIPLGRDLGQVLRDQVITADVVLAVIGPRWLDDEGRARLGEPNDWVRIELAQALKSDLPVVPVLVHEALMPTPEDLPPELRGLADLQAVRLSHERFERDVAGLISVIDGLAETGEAEERRKRGRRARQDRRKAPVGDRRKRGPVEPADGQDAELENWEQVKETGGSNDLRDHIARFPGGRSEKWARTRLAQVVWEELGGEVDQEDLSNYVAEFETSPYTVEARKQLQQLDRLPLGGVDVPRGGVFISYRRDDARLWALLLYASIAQRIGRDRVFLDSVNIPFGEDYARYIRRELPGYGVAVVLMGPGWRGERPGGPPRIEDPNDLFRIELELAIQHRLTILPVTLDGLPPPHDESQLPESVRPLCRLNMYGISARKFEEESPRLLSAIEEHHERVVGDDTVEEFGAFIAGAGLGVDNRTLLGNVERLLQTKLDRAIRRLVLGVAAMGIALVATMIGAMWAMVGG